MIASEQHDHTDAEYGAYMTRMQAGFTARVAGKPVFHTEAGDKIWERYLNAFPAAQRQHHNCNACRHFLQRYGDLVIVEDDGRLTSAVWDSAEASPEYAAAARELKAWAERGRITRPFITDEVVLGTPESGGWQHLSLAAPPALRNTSRVQTASQVAAEKVQDFAGVRRALAEYKVDDVRQAVALLESDSLYRSEKVLGPAKWLLGLYAFDKATLSRGAWLSQSMAHALIWRAVATAPAGFAHVRSSMIGTLLDDIAAGLSFADASRKFKAKMAPNVYQRPTAAPKASAIDQAEKIFAAMGAERALARRFARLDELPLAWRPEAAKPADAGAGGVFGHLRGAGAEEKRQRLSMPAVNITWAKFASTVLPRATALDYFVPYGMAAYCAYVTAVHADAPPIIQWDSEGARNPVSWYVYPKGSAPRPWGLMEGARHRVLGVAMSPHMMMGGESPNHAKGALFALEDCRDVMGEKCGGGLFPEILRSEFHGVRAVIEAHSHRTVLGGLAEGDAQGVLFTAGGAPVTVRAYTDVAPLGVDYTVDRWD